MNILSLTAIILTVAVVQGGGTAGKPPQNNSPCKHKSPETQYNAFVQKHVLSEKLGRKDKQRWGRYLNEKGLCERKGRDGRVIPVQSFIYADQGQVDQICSSAGWRVQGATGPKGNLCISQASMKVYDVTSRKRGGKCTVTNIELRKDPVVVACNKVKNRCLPVHYEQYKNQKKDKLTCA